MSEFIDLNNENYYLNRECSWLEFNDRVLEEAIDKTNLIMDRLKFLSISASNLDEFFMVRVSGIMDQVVSNIKRKDPSGFTPQEQLTLINKRVHDFVTKQYNYLNRSLLVNLEKENIIFPYFDDLTNEQKEYAKNYFSHTLYPILTPMAVDKSRPFPFLNNKSINFIIKFMAKDKDSDTEFALMQLPTVVPRILKLPSVDGSLVYIMIENIIKEFIGQLFLGNEVEDCSLFRITRNSDLSIDEEDAEDLLHEIENSIKRRKWGEPVRLELDKKMAKHANTFIRNVFNLTDDEIYEINGPLDPTVWMEFSFRKEFAHLRSESIEPQPAIDFINKNIFDAIKENDILVHHPYQSFDCVLNYVKEASVDPNVLAIKQTLYRVSGNSPIVNALIAAAENGKQVTVLVELKARFDEENNILWAKKLEKSGAHVVYGLVGLKTHCKICLVVRKEDDGIRRYVHLGTGNYNDSTAKIYTDLGYFTCKETFGQDISTLFNTLTGYSINKLWNEIAVAPITLRETFVRHIKNECNNAKEGKPTSIILKMNSLVDVNIIQELYKASMAGVKIKLIIRGICCLKTDIKGVSDNIVVVSIVDKYLEHSRIYYFENNGNPNIFLSSADCMPRNLDRRVEVAFPIKEPKLKKRIIEILDISLSDTTKLRILKNDGSYEKIDRRGKSTINSQSIFYEQSINENAEFYRVDNSQIFRPIEKPVVD